VSQRLLAQPGFYTSNWDNSLWAVLAQLLGLGKALPQQLAGSYRYMLHEFIKTWKNGKVPEVGWREKLQLQEAGPSRPASACHAGIFAYAAWQCSMAHRNRGEADSARTHLVTQNMLARPLDAPSLSTLWQPDS
jgi:hypothetical protein